MKINLDEGYSFGLGLFETLHIYNNKPIFLNEHIERINSSIDILKINCSRITEKEIIDYLKWNKEIQQNQVLKIIISDKNKIFLKRDYNYTKKNYEEGFKINIAETKRNTTSIFTYHKTLNYADNIYEKRKSLNLGFDEPLFLNFEENIAEGATSNIFLIKNNKIYTPKITSGILNGILRKWLIKNYEVNEVEIAYKDIKNYDEIFLTNSLFGIMPVSSVENIKFLKKESYKILENYRNFINNI